MRFVVSEHPFGTFVNKLLNRMALDPMILKDFLEAKVRQYNTPAFIDLDPVQIPHRYSDKEDIEISGLLTATISWGYRPSIIKNARRLMEMMGDVPFEFIMSHNERSLERLAGFVHRTFNGADLSFFVSALRYIYKERGGLEGIFTKYQMPHSMQAAIHQLRKEMLSVSHLTRTEKHLPDPLNGSAAKRINMFLRWMVRDDGAGVDFGIWKGIPPAILSCPLDVHTGNVSRKLGMLSRKQNDAKAVKELDDFLRQLDPDDPVKYDFALFGLGMYEGY